MSRKCSVCAHDRREDIDQEIIQGDPYRVIAGRHSVSKSAVERHRRDHLPRSLLLATESAATASADRLLTDLCSLQARTIEILNRAEGAGDLRTALLAIREARGCIELLGRLAGELNQTRSVDVTISPVWIEIRSKVLDSLAPYPDAREAVARALIGGNDDW